MTKIIFTESYIWFRGMHMVQKRPEAINITSEFSKWDISLKHKIGLVSLS